MKALRDLTLASFHEGLLDKQFSALEIAQAFFAHIKETDPAIGAYVSTHETQAFRDAEAVDLAVARDEALGPLAGAPIAVKDNILVKGLPATAGSLMLENYTASYDATVIQKLKKERVVILGKTNLDEFAMGSSTENSAFKITKNPHDPERVPGGSSGGSAAALAAHLALAALGSDTGGSIREPASFCGVVGLKPTYGTVSRSGLIAMGSSLDQIGPLTKTVDDAALLFQALAGPDPLDATTAMLPEDEYKNLLNPDFQRITQLTIGLPREYFIEGLAPEVSRAMDAVIHDLKSMGVQCKPVSLPHTRYALSTYYIVMMAEVSSNLARFDGIRYARLKEAEGTRSLYDLYRIGRSKGFGNEVKRRIILGTFVLSSGYYDAYYDKAQRVRQLIKNDFDEVFERVDTILSPVSPTPAFRLGEKTEDPLTMYLSDIFTIPVNLAGLPAVSIPVQNVSPLPIGFQLIGKPFHEADILGMGHFYEALGTTHNG